MKGVTSEVIADVRSRANLLDVISEFVVLKRAGKDYRGLCPFHGEKTPSFHVSVEKGIYKCFGCGEGGDVFAFVQKVKGLDFLDTVRELAHRYGVRLVETTEDREQYDKRSTILMLYQQAAEYYSHLLNDPREGAFAREYLKSRNITDETIEQFKLGFAPASWDGLLRFLTTSTKVSPATLEEAGLVRRKPDSTSCYDLFRNRLMIPICDDQGRVIAFGGRAFGDEQVKYLNSPETPIYTKGQHLFAFHQAKDHIKKDDGVIVVEGYFDAITAHQYGFRQTVATLGTALTDKQARLLVRYTESRRVYLSFDADSAGQRAVDRGIEMLSQIAEGIGIELRVIKVPGGKDPDESLRCAPPHGGPEAFQEAINKAPLLIDYQLERAVAGSDLKSHTGRIDAARQLVPILGQIKNSVARGEYIRQWSQRLHIREEELLSDVGQYRRQKGLGLQPIVRPVSNSTSRAMLKPGDLQAERSLLALYLTSRDDYDRVRAAMADEMLLDPVHQSIKEAIEGIGSNFNTVEDLHYRLLDRLAPEPEAARVLVEVTLKCEEIRKQKAPVDLIIRDNRSRLLRERLDRELRRLNEAQSQADWDEFKNIGIMINELRRLQEHLPTAETDEALSEIRRKIDRISSAKGPVQQVETSV